MPYPGRSGPGGAVLLAAGLALGACSGTGPPTQIRTATPAGLSADDVRAVLESAPAGRQALGIVRSADEPVFCGVHVYGASPDGAYTYAWALCETFGESGGRVVVGSGVSMPVRVRAANGAVTVPEDGIGWAASVRAMFPPDLAGTAIDGKPVLDAEEPDLLVRATQAFSRNGTAR